MRRQPPNLLDILLSLLIAASEALTLAPWLHIGAAMTSTNTKAPSAIILGLFGFVAFWLARTFFTAQWETNVIRGIVGLVWVWCTLLWIGFAAGGGILAPLTGIEHILQAKGDALIRVLLSGLAWWRGLRLGAEPRPFNRDFWRTSVFRDLVLIGSALAVVLFSSHHPNNSAEATLARAIPSLVAMRLLTAVIIQATMANRTTKQSMSNPFPLRSWLLSAGSLTAFVVGAAAIVSLLAGTALWDWITIPLSWIWTAATTVIFFILVALAYALFLIIMPLAWAVRRFSEDGQSSPSPPALPTFHEVAEQARFSLPPIVRLGLEAILGVFIAVAVIALIVRGFRRYRDWSTEETAEDIHEGTWSRELVQEQIRQVFRRMVRRTTTSRIPHVPKTVREAYQATLWLLRQHQLGRQPWETPLDYLTRLQQPLRDAGDALTDLTHRYLIARYGERSSPEDDTAATADWQRLRQVLRAQADSQKKG